MVDVNTIAAQAESAGVAMAMAPTERKNGALRALAARLDARRGDIVSANENDLAEAARKGLPDNLVRRLRFGESKIDSRIRCLEKIAALPDPVGQVLQAQRRPNGLEVCRVRVPLGVILMVYEARPHVTINAGAFCLKSGNAAILRGGSEAGACNALLGELWRESLEEAALPSDAVQVIQCSHDDVDALLQMNESIDLVIPRGGKQLIESVYAKSRIPVVKHFEGICHVYLDRGFDLSRAVDVVLDSKCLMPEVCNAMETLLVNACQIQDLPRIVDALHACGVVVKGCERTRSATAGVEPAGDADWRTEYLDSILSVRVVDTVDEAIAHINTYGSRHTDSIVTDSVANARQFVSHVDSGVVLVNASTMFCDGESLGMGAEIGISTDKLHARGPMGLEELTSYKHVIRGEGHVMGDPDSWRRNGG